MHLPSTSFFTCFFFFNDTATTEIYTLSLHDALPTSPARTRPIRHLSVARRDRRRRTRVRIGDQSASVSPASRATARRARHRRSVHVLGPVHGAHGVRRREHVDTRRTIDDR